MNNNMENGQYGSQHIILQLDTDSLIADYSNNEPGNPLSSGTVRKHTIIYTQGAMSMGSPVKDFSVEIFEGQDVYLSIVPLQLFSFHRLYFTGCNLIIKKGQDTQPIGTIPSFDNQYGIVSFILPYDELLRFSKESPENQKKKLSYSLGVKLDYTDDQGQEQSIDLVIDPKLKIRQTG